MDQEDIELPPGDMAGEMAGEMDDIPDYDDDGDDAGDSLNGDANLFLSDSEEGGGSEEEMPPPVPWTEQVGLIHLRRYIDQLAETVQEKDYVVQKMRGEQKKCAAHVEELEEQRTLVFSQIQDAEAIANTAAVYRLRAQHDRLCEELEAEMDLEAEIRNNLHTAEAELAHAQVEQGKMLLAEVDLQQEESNVQRHNTAAAHVRTDKEQKYAEEAARRVTNQHRSEMSAVNHQRQRQQHALNEAQRSKDKASKHLKRTVTKLREREAEEEKRQKEHLEQRMNTMLKLKGDIVANRENLKALQARDRAMTKQREAEEEKQRQAILSAGGNPSEEMIKQNRLDDFEKEKVLFREKQRERELEIAEKLLEEEGRMKKRKQQHPQLFTDANKEKEKIVQPMKKRPLKLLEQLQKGDEEPEAPPVDWTKFEKKSGDESDDDDVGYLTATRNTTLLPDSDSEEEQTEDLAQPEFEGMWDQHKPYNIPKDTSGGPKLPGASKMQKDIMNKVLEKTREGIIVKQVAGGKEFRGCPFYSKPDVIHFKDFEVGKTYKKKVTLTNVSYSVNYCKLTGLTEHLKDFIELQFDPPGQMSAGLTCDLHVTFKPMINEDLDGTVQFLAQTGPFSIPLCCTTKKCDLSVDSSLIEFGTSVIGETLRRTVTLTNKGALPTHFDFYKVTGMKQRATTTAETSLGRLTTADSNMRGVSPDSDDMGLRENKTVPPTLGKADDGEGAAVPPQLGTCLDDNLTVTDASGMPDMEELYSLDGMKIGHTSSGDIGAFSSVQLEIVWQPTIPGKADTEFIVAFADPASQKIAIMVQAHAIDVPVWVQRQTVDLKVCTFDRLYQDTIMVNNRATTALRLKFEVCKELRNHLELLPKTGYIQAQSSFSAQLKFLPRKSLFEEAGELFDKETGVLEAPMVITVANQTRPVPFTVHAVVTNSDMEFDVSNLDFGCCTIHESTRTTIQLTNKSILPQQFGFVGLPEYVEVQPNDGFGTLLPLETIDLDVIFQPKKARDYTFELVCKSLINREFRVKCQGVGVHPPLELSQQIIHFAATSVNDVSTASLHIVNSHTSTNQFTHPVPRIGTGDIAPVGPTSFEFCVPEGAPIAVSPSVGTVEPGKKLRVQVRFTPTLDGNVISTEAVRMLTKTMEQRARDEFEAQLQKERESMEQAAKGKKPQAKGKPSPKGNKKQPEAVPSVVAKGPPPIQPPDKDKISKDSNEYSAAHGSLLRQFSGTFGTFIIPCYIASGKCANPGELPYSIHNTLYLEVHCPAVKPHLVVISDSGRTTTDFGEVSIGQSVIRPITIQNISPTTLKLSSTCIDPTGPFSMLNAMRTLAPDASHTILMCFRPQQGEVEELCVECGGSGLHIILKGCGVSPLVTLSVEDNLMDMGAVIVGEYREEQFKIVNTSSLSVQFTIRLDSQSLLRHSKSQGLPAFVRRDQPPPSLVGVQNKSGQQVYDCVPAEGFITAGGTQEIMVTFAPDHACEFYSDGIRIELFGQEEQHVFRVVGTSREHIMYITGGDAPQPEVESLTVLPAAEVDEDAKPPPIPILVTLQSVAKETELTMATKDIYVGCVRTMAVSQKKNGEWIFDSLSPIQPLGFNIDPMKGLIEAGSKRPVTITWTPPVGHDPNRPIEASINVTVKGDVAEVYRLLLRAIVVSD